jgi:DNA repair protein RadC
VNLRKHTKSKIVSSHLKKSIVRFEYLFYDSIDDTITTHQDAIYKEILLHAERYSALGVIVARNNLSLETNPTPFDIEFVKWLCKELRVSAPLLDYWIISDKVQISLAKQGLIGSLNHLNFVKSICEK